MVAVAPSPMLKVSRYQGVSCVIFLLLIKGLITTGDEDCRNEDLKCTKKDPRKIYRKCFLYSVDWTLFCNQSNFIKVPDPYTILPYTSCSNATALYIDDSCLKEIKKEDIRQYPDIVTFLGGRNYLNELPDHLFSKNKNLTKIDLCGNQISDIDPTAFYGLSRLVILNLASNVMTYVPDFVFRGLNSLTELSFHDNKIAVLHSGGFRGLRNLKILKLTANRIGFIDPRAFDGIGSLTHLHLDENRLKTVNANIFMKLSKLEVLTLSYNRLSEWNGGTYLQNLHTLDLVFNLISKFESSHVTNMTKLQNLSLENNSLTSLSDDVFLSTPDLSYLNLAENYLEEIGTNTFSYLCHLETLVLRGNALKTPRMEWLTRIVKNNVTRGNDVTRNKWECNCDVIEYQKFLRTLKERKLAKPSFPDWYKIFQITCNSPAQLQGQKLDEATAYHIQTGCATHNITNQPPLPCGRDPVFRRMPTTPQYIPTTSKTTIKTTTKNASNTPAKIDNLATVTESESLPPKGGFTHEKVVTVVIWVALFVALVVIIIIVIRERSLDFKICLKKRKRAGKDGEKLIALVDTTSSDRQTVSLPATPNSRLLTDEKKDYYYYRSPTVLQETDQSRNVPQETRPKLIGGEATAHAAEHEYEEMRPV